MTEALFYAALKPRYPAGEWALLPQVRNQTGFSRTVRTADALAVSLFPSRGIDAHGFEFKDSRTDWLKELKQPAKAEEIGRYCAFWWVVVSDPAIVRKDELPPAWGLMAAADGVVKVVTKAPRREAEEPGWRFVAAVLRAAAGYVTGEDEIDRRVKEAVSKATAPYVQRDHDAAAGWRKQLSDTAESYASRIRAFEAASGVQLDHYSADRNGKIGEAVRFVLAGGVAGLETRVREILDQCRQIERAARAAGVASPHDPVCAPARDVG